MEGIVRWARNIGNRGVGGSGSGRGRRAVLSGAAAGVVGLGLGGRVEAAHHIKVHQGRINQSLVYWCYKKYWDVEKMCQVAKELGCVSIELIGPEHWPTLKRYGLVCALAGSHGFTKGMNNPEHWPMCFEKIRKGIDACHDSGVGSVISFTGFAGGVGVEEGCKKCVKG